MKLQLVLQKDINGTLVDGYTDIRDAWFTRLQIGNALEYANPQKSIDKIHNKHKERLDSFSRVIDLVASDGKTYSTYVYNFKGVMEICRWSRQPKADMVMDALYDMAIEVINKGYYCALKGQMLGALIVENLKVNPHALDGVSLTDLKREAVIRERRERKWQVDELIENWDYHNVPPQEIRDEILKIFADDYSSCMTALKKFDAHCKKYRLGLYKQLPPEMRVDKRRKKHRNQGDDEV